MKPQLTPAFLLEGLVKAIHSSRVFLRDAIYLFNNDRFATAYIIGVVATEQLGRANWMLKKYDEMVAQVVKSIDCKKFGEELRQVPHLANLRSGIMSLRIKTTPELLRLTDLLQRLNANTPEFEAAANAYRQIYADLFETHAKTYHKTRQRLQYVNPDETCGAWTTPLQIARDEVDVLLANVGAANRVMVVTINRRSDILQMMDQLDVRKELQNWRDTWLPQEWEAIERHQRLTSPTKR